MKSARDLAESWETPDALTYVFRLKKGMKDAQNDVRLHHQPGKQVTESGSLRMIASIEAPDALTRWFFT